MDELNPVPFMDRKPVDKYGREDNNV